MLIYYICPSMLFMLLYNFKHTAGMSSVDSKDDNPNYVFHILWEKIDQLLFSSINFLIDRIRFWTKCDRSKCSHKFFRSIVSVMFFIYSRKKPINHFFFSINFSINRIRLWTKCDRSKCSHKFFRSVINVMLLHKF